ncbi:DNA repair protein RAD51 homolog 2 isoform X6 [Dromaius novaehollandiae]|uniref:DNA repair protein RAD51 homolog 2 n=1 Tax=Dromaius novaehollandiae TaxID=8790 RepID=A0A8C4J2B1_DRONO
MAAKKLRRARLSQELCERLSRHQITTCQDFLCLSLLDLMKVTGQSYGNVQKLLCKVSLACAPKMQTAYEMKVRRAVNPSSAFLSTSLHGLDKVLHGGVPCGSLTEITSPPGCGKTQFCIMMSVLATLPISMGGLNGAVIYIDTESAFSAERLVEIAGNRFPAYFDSDEKLFSMTCSVYLYRELTCGSVLKRIKSLEEEIISKKVKLIIIDSVASVVRKEFDTKLQGNLTERSNFLARGASLLKYLAEEFSIPVILTNQITTRLSNGPAIQADLVSPADDLSLSEGKCMPGPALGLQKGLARGGSMKIRVAKSPVAPFSTFFYTIEKSGFVLQDGKDQTNLTWEGTSPALQNIKVRNTALKDLLPDAALPRTTDETPSNASSLQKGKCNLD